MSTIQSGAMDVKSGESGRIDGNLAEKFLTFELASEVWNRNPQGSRDYRTALDHTCTPHS